MAQEAQSPHPVSRSDPDEQSSDRDVVNALSATLAKYQEINLKQIRHVTCLAVAIAILAIVMVLGLGVQIWLALLGTPD